MITLYCYLVTPCTWIWRLLYQILVTYLIIHIITIFVAVQYFISVQLIGYLNHLHNHLVLFPRLLSDLHYGLQFQSLIIPQIFSSITLFYFRASLTAIFHSFVYLTVIWYTLVTETIRKHSFICWILQNHIRYILPSTNFLLCGCSKKWHLLSYLEMLCSKKGHFGLLWNTYILFIILLYLI